MMQVRCKVLGCLNLVAELVEGTEAWVAELVEATAPWVAELVEAAHQLCCILRLAQDANSGCRRWGDGCFTAAGNAY